MKSKKEKQEEFVTKALEELNGAGFHLARMISGSKSFYRDKHPNNLVVFNANIICKSAGKVWYGDLDLTIDGENLIKVAGKLGEPIYVLREMDARFGIENKPVKQLLKRAVWDTKDGHHIEL